MPKAKELVFEVMPQERLNFGYMVANKKQPAPIKMNSKQGVPISVKQPFSITIEPMQLQVAVVHGILHHGVFAVKPGKLVEETMFGLPYALMLTQLGEDDGVWVLYFDDWWEPKKHALIEGDMDDGLREELGDYEWLSVATVAARTFAELLQVHHAENEPLTFEQVLAIYNEGPWAGGYDWFQAEHLLFEGEKYAGLRIKFVDGSQIFLTAQGCSFEPPAWAE